MQMGKDLVGLMGGDKPGGIFSPEENAKPVEFGVIQRATMKPDTTLVRIERLKPHPRNPYQHPDEEIEQIVASIKEHGLYAPVVVANDMTILKGHGVTMALLKLGFEYIHVLQIDYDPLEPRALKLLIGDNEIGRLAMRDDRAIADIAKEVKEFVDLAGTGYEDSTLANLVYITRSANEIGDTQAAAQWAGMPAYEETSAQLKLTVLFPSEADRDEFGRRLGVDMSKVGKAGLKQVLWWPKRVVHDLVSVQFSDRPEGEVVRGDSPWPTDAKVENEPGRDARKIDVEGAEIGLD
jgi:hypothetical protein